MTMMTRNPEDTATEYFAIAKSSVTISFAHRGDVYDVGDGDDKQIERSVSHLLFSGL